jgi:two-component system, OmpR family, response regulator
MTDATTHILIIDDEPQARAVLAQALTDEGFKTFEAANRDEAMHYLAEYPVDLITLDLRLGQMSGLDIAKEIRAKRNIPIVMITGCDEPLDRVTGLEHGADDYITKPFHIREVSLRLRNVLKRYARPIDLHFESHPEAQRYAFDRCILDTRRREVLARGGGRIDLTDLEFRLLLLLVENCTRVLSRDEISRAINGHDWSPFDRTIDGHIARLRRKLETPADEPRLIKSVRGIGYVFTSEVSRI